MDAQKPHEGLQLDEVGIRVVRQVKTEATVLDLRFRV